MSFIRFYVILLVALQITGVTLREYKGLNTLGLSQIGAYLSSIPVAYRDYFSFFAHTPYLSRPIQYLQHIFSILGVCAYGYLLFFKKVWRTPTSLILQLAGFALLPLALSITSALTPAPVSMLNQYAYILHFVFCLKFIELDNMK